MSPKPFALSDNPRLERKIRVRMDRLEIIQKLIITEKYSYFDEFVNEAVDDKLIKLGLLKKPLNPKGDKNGKSFSNGNR